MYDIKITNKDITEKRKVYESVRSNEIFIYEMAEKINKKVKGLYSKAYIFMDWYPYRIEEPSCEDAFIRETINYYILLGECAKYLWFNNRFKNFLKKFGFDAGIHANKFFNALRGMRNFFCHRYDPISDENITFVCDFFGLFDYGSIEYEDLENCYVSIKKDYKFWNCKREELFNSVMQYLNDLDFVLDKIFENNKEEFIDEWKGAVSSWYSADVYHWKKWIVNNLEAMCEEVPFSDCELIKSFISSRSIINNITKNLSKNSLLFKDAFNDMTLESLEPIYVLEVILKNEFKKDKLLGLTSVCK